MPFLSCLSWAQVGTYDSNQLFLHNTQTLRSHTVAIIGRHTIMVVKPIGVAEKAVTDALSRRGLRERTIMKVEMFKIDERQFVYRVPSG